MEVMMKPINSYGPRKEIWSRYSFDDLEYYKNTRGGNSEFYEGLEGFAIPGAYRHPVSSRYGFDDPEYYKRAGSDDSEFYEGMEQRVIPRARRHPFSSRYGFDDLECYKKAWSDDFKFYDKIEEPVMPRAHRHPLGSRYSFDDPEYYKKAGDDSEVYEGVEHVMIPRTRRHPLPCVWKLWYYRYDRSKDWHENLHQIATFNTIEDFWILYNYLQPASKLRFGCDYSIFKDGVQPKWEDEYNRHGGRWIATINNSKRQKQLDEWWLETLLCVIGDTFCKHSNQICGAVVNIRTKWDKVSLWIKDCQDSSATVEIGQIFKYRLGTTDQLDFQVHADTISKNGCVTTSRFNV